MFCFVLVCVPALYLAGLPSREKSSPLVFLSTVDDEDSDEDVNVSEAEGRGCM